MKTSPGIDFFKLWNLTILNKKKSRFDKHNMFKSIKDFPSQIIKSFDIESKFYKQNSKNIKNISNNIESILICGMGGSAIGGDILRVLIKDEIKIPLFVSRHYVLPNWVNEDTLVICSSYSGNTEEIGTINSIFNRHFHFRTFVEDKIRIHKTINRRKIDNIPPSNTIKVIK